MTNEMLHRKKVGERLKKLWKENGYKRALIARITGYSEGNISDICSGKRKLTREAAEKLAREWHIRPEYILCEDDFKTEEELSKYINNRDLGEMQAALKYLESLGLVLKPRNILLISLWSVYRIINGYYDIDLEDFVKKEDIKVLKEKYDFSLSEEEFNEAYHMDEWQETFSGFPTICQLELSAPVPTSGSFELLTEDNYSKTSSAGSYPIAPKDSPFHTLLNVVVFFDVYYDGEFKQRIGFKKLQSFVKTMDLHTKISIENNLLDGAEGDVFIDESAIKS